mgnify:CR=1 FL=1
MDRRTALISAASVVGVVLAGATAVGANIGILDQADNSGIGELSAAADTTAVEPRVIDVQLDPQSPSPTIVRLDTADTADTEASDDTAPQPFIVEDAGVVSLEATADGIRISEVTPNGGWTWIDNEPGDGTVSITFDSDDATYVFTASLAEDGSVLAAVEQPIIQIVTKPAPTSSSDGSAAAPDGDHDDDEFDDHEYEYDDAEYDDDEYEDDEDDEHEDEDEEEDEDDDHDEDEDEDDDDEDDEHEGRDDDD